VFIASIDMRILTSLCVLVIVSTTARGEDLPLGDVLARYDRHRQGLSSCSFNTLTVSSYADSVDGRSWWNREEGLVCLDGERIDQTVHLWMNATAPDDMSRAQERNTQVVWDGQTWFDYQYGHAKDAGRIRTTQSTELRDSYRTLGFLGAPLDGVFRGDLSPFSVVLQQAKQVQVSQLEDKADGAIRYVIEARTASGAYKVVLDPQHGYGISEASLVKTGDDMLFGEALSSPPAELPPSRGPRPLPPRARKTRFAFTLRTSRFERIGDVWIPTAGDWETTTQYEDGRVITEKTHHERSSVDLSPDFAAMGAFRPKVRNGARASVVGKQSIVPLYWRDGKIGPMVDESVLERLDQNLMALAAESGRRQEAPAATQRADQIPGYVPSGPAPTSVPPSAGLWRYAVWGAIGTAAVLAVILWRRPITNALSRRNHGPVRPKTP
jgi:hypothetical protein